MIIMKIFVKAKPNSREEKIEKIDETHFIISVKEPPVGGKANRAIIQACADYFGCAPSTISIMAGLTSREKVLEIV